MIDCKLPFDFVFGVRTAKIRMYTLSSNPITGDNQRLVLLGLGMNQPTPIVRCRRLPAVFMDSCVVLTTKDGFGIHPIQRTMNLRSCSSDWNIQEVRKRDSMSHELTIERAPTRTTSYNFDFQDFVALNCKCGVCAIFVWLSVCLHVCMYVCILSVT